ncbi:hypothetical protein NQ314_011029 [Rhamnusium bicolor]|uniref:Uncharacterized protein n=1 Tax=Rhamnusium bicolor TaxID=1586634 RepID=A0AAV8XMI2_9CUCU|nr:hypothetical protein NQ314_011029 [Rhamnusium bicolor]
MPIAAIRQREAEERAREEEIRKAEERNRRPSRFEVVPAPDVLQRQMSENHLDQVQKRTKYKIGHYKLRILTCSILIFQNVVSSIPVCLNLI